MKLIRLTSIDNGRFTNSFGNEMTLAPNSSMALLNLTFQTNLGILIDIPAGETITFQGYERQGEFNVLRVTNVADLPPKLFRVADLETFYKYIQFYLNTSIPFSRSYAVDQDLRPWTCSAYRITQNDLGFNQIEYRYAPFLNPLFDSGATGADNETLPLKSMVTDATQINLTYAGSVEGQRTSIKMADGVASTIDTNNNIVALEGRRLNDGSAFYCCRIFNYNDNGNAGVNDNGFSIGLSKDVTIEQGITIPIEKRNFEINFNRDTESYKFINNSKDGTLVTPNPTVLPELVSRGDGSKDQEHDIVGFEVKSGIVSSCVYQVKTELYRNLAAGNDWTQAGTGTTELFDTTNLGDVAKYRRTQPSVPALEHWWAPQAGSATGWNVYTTGPPEVGDPVTLTATIDVATGVITIAGTTFTPTTVPPVALTPSRHVLATSTLGPGEELNPYVYINGSSVNVELNMLNYSIDPWLIDGEKETDNNDVWQITGTRDSGLSNDYEFLSNHPVSPMNTIIPSIGELLVNGTVKKRWEVRTNERPSVALTLPKEVWRALGEANAEGTGPLRADPKRIGRSTNYQINWGLQKNVAYTSDNFMVVSDSIPLDSFDASRPTYDFVDTDNILSNTLENAGRRKNILMTIPENNNEDGLVEFETNTPIFIDMNNKTTINPRNLNFRILKKDFGQIDTGGTGESAVMTLLIKSGDK